MDKYEFRVSIDEIDTLIEERKFDEAAAIADTIDWTKVRSTFRLCRISDLYKINRRYADSRDLLEIAYERKPDSRKIIYSLCELELKLNNYIHALQLYNAFINVAPRDPDRFLLQYKLYKKQDVNVHERISVLEEFLRRDFRERWAYELAELYLEAGDEQRCASQCDEIVAYFGDGRFVIRALQLKKSLTPLTPQQEEHLEILLSGGKYIPPAPKAEESASSGTEGAEESGTTAEQAESPSQKTEADEEQTEVSAGEGETDREPDAKTKASAADSGAGTGGTREVFVKKSGSEEPAAGADFGSAQAPESGFADTADEAGLQTADEEDGAETAGNPEEYTDTLLNEVRMEETIARGMREIDDYGSVLAQETSGQLAMVMEEDPQEEKADDRLDLEQIMSEWEKIRRNSEQQRLAEARRRVLEKSDAAKRELYGDDYTADSDNPASEPVVPDEAGEDGEDDVQSGTTRSWDSEDVRKRMKK